MRRKLIAAHSIHICKERSILREYLEKGGEGYEYQYHGYTL